MIIFDRKKSRKEVEVEVEGMGAERQRSDGKRVNNVWKKMV